LQQIQREQEHQGQRCTVGAMCHPAAPGQLTHPCCILPSSPATVILETINTFIFKIIKTFSFQYKQREGKLTISQQKEIKKKKKKARETD
jgi:hypothetical protein